jgi:hypothetical protein
LNVSANCWTISIRGLIDEDIITLHCVEPF